MQIYSKKEQTEKENKTTCTIWGEIGHGESNRIKSKDVNDFFRPDIKQNTWILTSEQDPVQS